VLLIHEKLGKLVPALSQLSFEPKRFNS